MVLITYTDVPTMRVYMGLNASTQFDTLLAEAITSASREVDKRTKRYFGKDAVLGLREFDCEGNGLLVIDDVADPYSMVLHGGIVTYTAYPRNGVVDNVPGNPTTYIKSCSFYEGYSYSVSAIWGWAEVPENISEATKQLAAKTFLEKDAPFGVKGMDEFGSVRIRDPQHTADLLQKYTRYNLGSM